MTDVDAVLSDLTARLDALEQRNDALARENAALRAALNSVTASDAVDIVPTTPAALERMSRRWLMRRGAQMAAASLAAGVLLERETREAHAESFESVHVAQGHPDVPGVYSIHTGGGVAISGVATSASNPAVIGRNWSAGAGITGINNGDGAGVVGDSWGQHKAGVLGRNPNGAGVRGEGGVGVFGIGPSGVIGESNTAGWAGVYGKHNATGPGVVGDGFGVEQPGVLGRNNASKGDGAGVKGEGGYGVWGVGTHHGVVGDSSRTNYAGVVGRHSATGYGVIGDSVGSGLAGVLGRDANGAGVKGEGGYGVWGVGYTGVVGESLQTDYGAVWGNHTGTSGYGVVGDGKGSRAGVLGRNAAGIGVRGEGKTGASFVGQSTGYGATIQGGKAQLRLVPGTTSGKPTTGSHWRGELYFDRGGTLWVCTVSGSPGTWRRFSTTAS